MGYAAFHRWVGAGPGRQELLASYPELERLLRLVTKRHAAHAVRVLKAATRDRDALEQTFGIGGRLVSLAPGMGDSHRGGQTVSVVRWERGDRLIHKPHESSCQRLLENVLGIVDRDGTFFGSVGPRSIVRPEHIWQERIEQADIGQAGGPAAYFRRFGRMSALLALLGANDLHHENVIAAATGPVVIDAETLVSLPVVSHVDDAQALPYDISVSVLSTLLYPTRFSGSKLDIDLSAIGGVSRGESRNLASMIVVDAGTDDIRFDSVPVTIEPGTSMATAAGQHIDPLDWAGVVVSGFDEARELLRGYRREIEQLIAGSSDWAIRHILRPTYIYWRFIEASTHPAYLTSTMQRETLLEKLPRTVRGLREEMTDALHREEIRAMLDLDVPHFDLQADTKVLRCNGSRLLPNATAVTPRQAALDRVAAFFDRPAQRDPAYIRYALATADADVWERRGREPQAASPSLDDAGPWHALLRELTVPGERGPTFLVPQLDGQRLHLAPLNALLHEGGGVLLYLARAGVEPAESVADRYAQASTAQLPAPANALALSPFTGTLSVLATGRELSRSGVPGVALPDVAPGEFTVDIAAADDFDYLNGLAGHLVYLCEYGGSASFVDLTPQNLLDRLIDVDGPPQEHDGPLGLAHGRFGRIAAISSAVLHGFAGERDARGHLERFAAAYLRRRWQDEALRDADSTAAWCKGHPGLAYAATRMLRAVGWSAGEIRDALRTEVGRIVDAPLGNDISFCHGVSGRLAMLCWLADDLAWPQLRDEAVTLNKQFLERYRDGGWKCGVGATPDLPSFLFGLSGWYFVQLMLADPTVRLPLCLGSL